MGGESSERFFGRLSIEAGGGGAISEPRVRLLEAIDRLGSINQAAKAVPLSYKAAWDAIDTMNNLSPEPLVVRVTGGRQGGGTELTDYGRRVVAMYRALELETQSALERASARLAGAGPGDVDAFRKLMRTMTVRNSARNQFAGPIVALRDGAVDFEVRLRLDEDAEIVAVITRASAENLGLVIGKEVVALVKSSSVQIAREAGNQTFVRGDKCNEFRGTIHAIHPGALHDEVTLGLPSGKNVTAVVPHRSCEARGLVIGVLASASFKASSVILVTYD